MIRESVRHGMKLRPYLNVGQLLIAVHVLAICWPLYWFLSYTSIHEGIDGVSDLLTEKKNVTSRFPFKK
jgi:hypothetical protein